MYPSKCENCGYLLAEGTTSEMCPQCSPEIIIASEVAATSAGAMITFEQPRNSPGVPTIDFEAKPGPVAQLPRPNSRVGNYQIIRQLGRGGMGAAFEAEQVDSGRRVALKFITSLPSLASHQRFLQEGQLAAAINHPNSVYIYATEVIGELPVISMELVRGLTLQEYVEQQGPLRPAAAVDVILQIIAGLEESDRRGILHRDIKPSNCFVADGVVKVGDFGLAVSLTGDGRSNSIRDGMITPHYAAPEQWQLAPLDVRSDIYAVGGTLHFLLTGRPPFVAPNQDKLEELVLHTQPPSAHALRPEVPLDLAKIVLRCLAKSPADRFQNHQELREALRPFGPEVWPAAHPLARVLAMVLDQFPIYAVTAVIVIIILACGVDPPDFWKAHPVLTTLHSYWDILYFGISEGRWGMSPGKWLLGIRVVNADRNPPGFWRATLRAAIFLVLPSVPLWIAIVAYPPAADNIVLQTVLALSAFVLWLLLFSSMRPRNGFAAWHDWLSGTRVQLPPPASGRAVIPANQMGAKTAAASELGPYVVTHTVEVAADYEWLIGYDEILQRRVWLRRIPAGSPPLPAEACQVSRGGRLRWLAGRRTASENWDAFEAVSGQPLVGLLKEPQSWQRVRFWLFDLAGELALAQKEGNLPARLGLNRVWITSAGHAKLLDIPAPGAGRLDGDSLEMESEGPHALTQFLHQVAVSALNGQAYPAKVAAQTAVTQHLPLHAIPIVASLRKGAPLDSIGQQLSGVLTKPTEVTHLRRAALVLCCLLLPLICAVSFLAFSLALTAWDRKMPEIAALRNCLIRYEPGPGYQPSRIITDAADRAQLETYIVGKFRTTIKDNKVWHSPYAYLIIPPDQRDAAERLVRTKQAPTAAELAAAEQQLSAQLAAKPFASDIHFVPVAVLILVTAVAIFVAIPALLWAVSFGVGPLQLIFGVGYVTRSGQGARRLRLLWRALLAWSPVLLCPIVFLLVRNTNYLDVSINLFLGVTLALTIASVLLPVRGIPERLAGVWLVRR